MYLKNIKIIPGILALILIGGFLLRISVLQWGFVLDRKWHFVTTVNSDERWVLRSLAKIHPAEFDFNPEDSQREGTLHPYLVAASLLLAEKAGYLTLTGDAAFYRTHPGEMEKLFMAGRLVSMSMDILGAFVLYCIGRRFFSPATGLLAAAWYVVVPVEFVQSTYMRTHSLANLLLLATLYAALHIAIGEGKKKFYILGGVAAGLSLATRIPMALTALLLPAAECIRLLRAKIPVMQIARAFFRPPFLLAPVGFFIGVLVGNPYLAMGPGQILGFADHGVGYTGRFTDLVGHVGNLPTVLFSTIPKGITLAVTLVAFVGLIRAFTPKQGDPLKKSFQNLGLLFLAFALPYGYLAFGGSLVGMPRYAMPFVPFLLLFAAWICIRLYETISPWYAKISVCIGIALLLAYPLLYDIAYAKAAVRRHSLETLADWVEKNISPEKKIGVTRRDTYTISLDFERYPHTVELQDDLAGLAMEQPPYVIVFPYHNDFYLGPQPITLFEPKLQSYGYREIARIRGDITLGNFRFPDRINGQLEYESRIYKKESR